MKIENEKDYKLISKLAYNLLYNAPFQGVEFTENDTTMLSNALDIYDKENGYTMGTPSPKVLNKHSRGRTDA